jgi:hypothetical protein
VAHRKRRSTERSGDYYGTDEGKVKTKIQNDKRSQAEARASDPADILPRLQVEGEGIRLEAAIVGYVGMVTSLIEGRGVSEEEIVEMLVRALRHHSIVRRRRMDYVLAYLKKNAP